MSKLTRELKIDIPGKTFTEICVMSPRKVLLIRRKVQDDTCKIRDLIRWAESTSESLKKTAQKVSSLSIGNVYYSRSEWIDYELLPKLRKLYPIKKKVASLDRVPAKRKF